MAEAIGATRPAIPYFEHGLDFPRLTTLAALTNYFDVSIDSRQSGTAPGITRQKGAIGMKYILSIDQSTSGTKAMLFDEQGEMAYRCSRPHKQWIDRHGYVEHDGEEILANVFALAREAVEQSGIAPEEVVGVAVTNQRETGIAFDRETGKPLCRAVVWQCSRGEEVCQRPGIAKEAAAIRRISGLPLSPYFTAAKFAWLLAHEPAVKRAGEEGRLCFGTMDSFLLWHLTPNHRFATDGSNACRTQLFDMNRLAWSGELCGLFGINPAWLPQVLDSDAHFGETDFCGLLPRPVPIHACAGDSHASLFGHGCRHPGEGKTSYGTGSSVMLHIGSVPRLPEQGLSLSLAWMRDGQAEYVLEGNVNYSGSIIDWLVKEVGLLQSPKEAGPLAASAREEDATCLVPAFSGLGSLYNDPGARAAFVGMSRSTGRAELVKAAEESVAQQIADVAEAFLQAAPALRLRFLSADGGGTGDSFLMQRQSDLLGLPLRVSALQELSGAGAAYLAGIRLGLYDEETLFANRPSKTFTPLWDEAQRQSKRAQWREAVSRVRSHQG